jgi:hypothetical protein
MTLAIAGTPIIAIARRVSVLIIIPTIGTSIAAGITVIAGAGAANIIATGVTGATEFGSLSDSELHLIK